MEIDDETRDLLGYGNSHESQVLRIAKRLSQTTDQDKKKSDLNRLKEYIEQNREAHNQAVSRWIKENPERIKEYQKKRKSMNMVRFGYLVGQKCIVCGVGTHRKNSIALGKIECAKCKGK